MKRFINIAGWVAAFAIWTMFILACVAYAQPDSTDTAGIITGTPTAAGNFLWTAVQLLSTVILTFYTSKLAGKLAFFDGWVAVFGTTGIGMGLLGGIGWVMTHFGLQTGFAFSWKAFGGFVLTTALYHFTKDKAKTATG